MDDILQCYAILGIKHNASPEAAKKAYRNMAKVWHPDRYVDNPTLKAKAEVEIKKINQAYAAIKAYSTQSVKQAVSKSNYSPQSKVAKKPHSSESFYQQGVVYAEQEDYDEALQSFARAIGLNPDCLEAYQYRGFILSKLGFKLRADAEFKKAHQIKLRKIGQPAKQYTPQTYKDRQSGNSFKTAIGMEVSTRLPLQCWQTIFVDRPCNSLVFGQGGYIASINGDREAEPSYKVSSTRGTRATELCASAHREINLWQANTGQAKGSLEGHIDRVSCLTVSPSGQTLISGSKDCTIKFWDLRKKKIVRTFGGQFDDHLSEITNLAISPDNQILLSCDRDNSLKVWDINHARMLKNISFSADVTCLAIHPNGQLFCSSGLEPQVKIRQIKNGEVVGSINHNSAVLSLAFSPDGRLLATAGLDLAIKLWDITTGREIYTLEGHGDRLTQIIFSSDRTLISSSWDKTIKLWDLNTGKIITTLEAHSAQINTMAISSDNQTLVTGSSDCTIKLWHCNYLSSI
jgi:WD40 repeat protein